VSLRLLSKHRRGDRGSSCEEVKHAFIFDFKSR
jgi:hypothetical protein